MEFINPELHQIFFAPMLCPESQQDEQHMVQAIAIELDDSGYLIELKVACTEHQCKSHTNKEGITEFEIERVDDIWISMEEWRHIVKRFNNERK